MQKALESCMAVALKGFKDASPILILLPSTYGRTIVM